MDGRAAGMDVRGSGVTHAGRLMSRLTYFYLTFIVSGSHYVVPQRFFLERMPTHAELWISACLVCGGVGGIAGVWWASHRVRKSPAATARPSATRLGLSLALTLSLFWVVNPWLFLLCYVSLQFITRDLYQRTDQRLVLTMPPAEVSKHVHAVTLWQLGAIVTAPVYFSLLYNTGWAHVIVLGGLTVLSYAMGVRLRRGEVEPPVFQAASSHVPARASTQTVERLYLVYSFFIHAATVLFASHAILIVRDYYRFEDAVWRGGLLVAGANLAAVIGVVFHSAVTAARHKPVGAVHHGSIVALSALLVWAMMLRLAPNYGGLMAITCLIGVCYGLFTVWTRSWASRVMAEQGRFNVLREYNNLTSYAGLIAFATGTVLALAARGSGSDFVSLIMWTMLAFLGVALACVVCIGVSRPTLTPPGPVRRRRSSDG